MQELSLISGLTERYHIKPDVPRSTPGQDIVHSYGIEKFSHTVSSYHWDKIKEFNTDW